MAPSGETIHGRTFWFDIREIISFFLAFLASMYKLLRPERVEGESSSWSIMEVT
ncbi:hypothetical protein Hanom_Chr13g01241551 [Helianthus anomalus]